MSRGAAEPMLMLEHEVYIKTDAGRDEIRSRTLGLPMAARAILLMVDGQRSVSAMRALIAGSKAPANVLDALVEQGLIEPRTAPTPVAPAPVAPIVVAPVTGRVAPQPAVAPVEARPVAAAPAPTMHSIAPAPQAAAARAVAFDVPLDLVLPTIMGPEASDPPPPIDARIAPMGTAPAAPAIDRYEHLYAMMNEIVRDFLAPHRRYLFQLKIERCTTADELLELLHGLQSVLSKARGEAFASDVIARLRSAAT